MRGAALLPGLTVRQGIDPVQRGRPDERPVPAIWRPAGDRPDPGRERSAAARREPSASDEACADSRSQRDQRGFSLPKRWWNPEFLSDLRDIKILTA